jgi:acetyl-CoA acetyltransferase
LSTRGKAAIVGAAESDLGEVGPGFTPLDLIGQAADRALADAGLSKEDVDGLFSASAYYSMATVSAGEYLGIQPRYSDATNMGGSSFVSHLLHAAAALEAGLCEVALVVYASTQRSRGGFRGSSDPPNPYETPYGPRHPISMYALAASRHMHEYGTTREQLAEVAVAAREWAKLNPKAFKRDPLTVEDVLASRMVSSPLSLLHCCLVTDGGALVVTSGERAKDLRKAPVYLLGAGEAHWHRNISQMPDLTVTAAVDSGRRAYETAGVGPADVHVAMLYNAFTITPILFLEDLGFCEKGEGGTFVEGGRIAPGGNFQSTQTAVVSPTTTPACTACSC